MKALLLTLLHWAVMTATLCGPGGVRAVIAENLLLNQQLIVLRRPRQRAPRLTASDRLLFGFGSLFLSPGRIRKVAIGVRPSTLLALHQALVRRTYRRLFSSRECPKAARTEGAERGTHPGHRRAQVTESSVRLSSSLLDRHDRVITGARPRSVLGEIVTIVPRSGRMVSPHLGDGLRAPAFGCIKGPSGAGIN